MFFMQFVQITIYTTARDVAYFYKNVEYSNLYVDFTP